MLCRETNLIYNVQNKIYALLTFACGPSRRCHVALGRFPRGECDPWAHKKVHQPYILASECKEYTFVPKAIGFPVHHVDNRIKKDPRTCLLLSIFGGDERGSESTHFAK